MKNQTLLVIAPHPDDETFGCAGLIAKTKKSGGKVFVLAITVGNLKQYGSVSNAEKRQEEFKKAMEFLKVDDYELAYIDDNYHLKLDTIPQKELIDLIEKKSKVAMNKIKPTIVAMPFGDTYFQDHNAVFKAAFAACRPRPKDLKSFTDTVLVYPTPSDNWSTNNFKPNFFVDISDELETKIKALSFYSSQLHPEPHPCSTENIKRIAQTNGTLIGTDAAEAFMCLRNVI